MSITYPAGKHPSSIPLFSIKSRGILGISNAVELPIGRASAAPCEMHQAAKRGKASSQSTPEFSPFSYRVASFLSRSAHGLAIIRRYTARIEHLWSRVAAFSASWHSCQRENGTRQWSGDRLCMELSPRAPRKKYYSILSSSPQASSLKLCFL